jgi:hypothetical protein
VIQSPSFRLADSRLFRRCVDDAGFDWDVVDHGEQEPGQFVEELSELDAAEVDVANALTSAEAADVLAQHPEYPEWSAKRLEVRGITPTRARQAAMVLVRQSLGRSHVALRHSCLDAPRHDDRLYTTYPDLFDRLTPDDRLLPLTADTFDGIEAGRDDDLIMAAGRLLALDPWLCGWPELVGALRTAASIDGLRVSVAIDRHRLPVRNRSRWRRLAEEQLWGVPLTLENIDSLDPKDQSMSFHAAMDRHPLLELSDPVFGTWISARAEPPRRIFYVQESLPADHDGYVRDGRLRIRALHAERDTTRQRFTHVDGKFELYPAAEWGPSLEAPMSPLPPPVARRKLWRVDAPEGMADGIWAELVSGFFRRNELVSEHFAVLGAQPVGA